MMYVTKTTPLMFLTLRLAIQVSIIACVCLAAAWVWGVRFNHSPILVYSVSTTYPAPYRMFLVDVERNLFSRIPVPGINGIYPTCSVNGQIAFMALKGETHFSETGIYVVDSFGEGLTEIVPDDEVAYVPMWSPDGKRLAFQSNSKIPNRFHRDVYVADLSEGVTDLLTDDHKLQGPLVWSPDGTQLLFVSALLDETTEIYAVNLTGNTRRLTDNHATEKGAVWSPDGTQIAFSSDEHGDSDIYMMDSDSGNLRRLTQDTAGEYFPAWSPDGQSIAYIHYAQRGQVYIMDADGKNQRVLADIAPSLHAPLWSPDGRYLAFISDNYADGKANIYLINARDGSYRVLIHAEMSFGSVSWCP